MHVIFRESHGLEETETPTDLGQSPADLVVLSFSDSDLTAFAAGWKRAKARGNALPSLRLANLSSLKHPLSVDTYVEQTLCGAKAVLVRLIGGASYWNYGLAQLTNLAQRNGMALAILPADGRADPQLEAASTVPASTLEQLNALCDAGGAVAAQAAIAQLALSAGLYAGPVPGLKSVPEFGCWSPDTGASACSTGACMDCPLAAKTEAPLVLVTFYRSYLTAADTAPIEALLSRLHAKGYRTRALFVPSLKAPDAAAWLAKKVKSVSPSAIINATAFSGKSDEGVSPLDAADCPVFQVALSTSSQEAWQRSERGLSPTDLAMHIVLPEVDGRIFAGVASFKEPSARDRDLEFTSIEHTPVEDRIEAIVGKVASYIPLSETSAEDRRIGLVLSTYPGKDWQVAHAVGLDALASAEAILSDMAAAGYSVGDANFDPQGLTSARLTWSVAEYRDALSELSPEAQQDLSTIWGAVEDDPSVENDTFVFQAIRLGSTIVALQPERGNRNSRDDDYHDLSRTPRHGYVAFYLWLRKHCAIHALVHVGAHGTLEWLPGKSVALSKDCWPEILIGQTPVIYPFIVNDPGEAAQAKRRIGAITLGHLPPPMKESATPEKFVTLEALLDEFSNADGLDPRRRERLQTDIRSEAEALGVEADLGLDKATCSAEALTRIDRFVCDIKESQFGDGLHVWGRNAGKTDGQAFSVCVKSEKEGLLSALSGRRIEAGPSGSPYRGRMDVLPTGRNLYTTDPRSVPTRSAYAQGIVLAEEMVRRHLQDHGDYPKGLIVDLWGSATMRTAGEEFAMALHLLGVKPVWDKGSERVSGIEVLPLALLDRPRIDVTLRISGLFRDVFPTLATLFSQAIDALRRRDEATDFNPFAGTSNEARVYGPKPGDFGLNMGATLNDYSAEGRTAAGKAWLAASAWASDGINTVADPEGLAARVSNADSFVHLQDLPETDVLLAEDYATHEAGFAAAKGLIGGTAQLYHLDNTNPSKPRARALSEEIARVVNARASNPDWIAGMRRHGYRGAAEIAATLDHMAAFAHLAGTVGSHLFDSYYDATLGEKDVEAFLESANPQALDAMRQQFAALAKAGLWQTRRNSIAASVSELT